MAPPKPPRIGQKTLDEMFCGMRRIGLDEVSQCEFAAGTMWLRQMVPGAKAVATIFFEAATQSYGINTEITAENGMTVNVRCPALEWPTDALITQIMLVTS